MQTKRILVIDDDEIIRLVLQLSLSTLAQWQVLTAATGQEGIKIAQTEQPDAILLDMMMPDMDGLATMHELNAQLETQNIPIILVTAKARMADKQQWSELAISGVITKPFEPSELVPTIQTMLKWEGEAKV
ncbi:response regulator [Acaryochloris sp. IP29b_bin.137]|uniref:response regulator n=1 Tax=Acaryochloris sp. IP29b_bin.137 TaxID=2969217 RepID=UPI00261F37BB|nr:response regulator [Acaryochloris sp. IP29b_bin.137]